MGIFQIISFHVVLSRSSLSIIIIISFILCFQLSSLSLLLVEAYQGGSRPQYIYDKASIIDSTYRTLLDNYLRQLDDSTSAEIIIYTIPSFIGHGIKSGGQEIQDRDTLANYIFNKASLDGITGIGKKGKDNGVLLLLSLNSDSSGGSMRIEVGRGLESNITDGIAGEILDTYLVPAKNEYIKSKNISAIDQGLLSTVVAIGKYVGYTSNDPKYNLSKNVQQQQQDQSGNYYGMIIFIIIFVAILIIGLVRGRRQRGGTRYWGSGTGRSGGLSGGFGGGGVGGWSSSSGSSGSSWSGGGGQSSGGGAGR